MAFYFSEYRRRFPGDVFYYGNASHAFYEVLIWLQKNRPRAKPNIVLPVFIPAKLYRIILAAGYEPKFYDISLDCQMDADQVKSLIDKQTQAVFYVHYFGIPASVKELKSSTAAQNVFFIENCAHTLNSRWKEEELGSESDCAIFSSRKMLQLPAGGFLVLNKKPWKFTPGYSKHVSSMFTACKLIQTRGKYAYSNLTRGYDPLGMAWIPDTGYIDFAEKQRVCVKQISWLNKAWMYSVDLEKIIDIRRTNYEYLLNGVRDLPFIKPVPVSGIASGIIREIGNRLLLHKRITPYSFPILTPVGTRNKLQSVLQSAGIGCGAGWPESPFGHSGFDDAAELSERLLELPVHPGINRYQMDRIISCLHNCGEVAERGWLTQTKKRRKSEVA